MTKKTLVLHVDERRGADEGRTESYFWYGEGVLESATKPIAAIAAITFGLCMDWAGQDA